MAVSANNRLVAQYREILPPPGLKGILLVR